MTSTIAIMFTCLVIIAAVVAVYLLSLARDVEGELDEDEAVTGELEATRLREANMAYLIKLEMKKAQRRSRRAERTQRSRKLYRN
jgi:hypothetical protein